jgi:hypothetical protein
MCCRATAALQVEALVIYRTSSKASGSGHSLIDGFADGMPQTMDALATEGLGVLTSIDVSATMRGNLGAGVHPLRMKPPRPFVWL